MLSATEFCFNRTFMELKLSLKGMLACTNMGFNRTFMELKYCSDVFFVAVELVLIVPLWN